MTLLEARNRTYWSRVDPALRAMIESQVSQGKSCIESEHLQVDDESRRALELLGYRVNAPGTLISWY